MKIPLKPSRLKIRRTKVKWIILHHTIEFYPDPAAMIDNSKYQLGGIFGNVMEQAAADINYHYVIDKVKHDYIPMVCRPFVTLCNFPDIDLNMNNSAIHIAMLGSYDFKVPEKRMYEILAYRIVNPLLKIFSLNPSRIKLHNEVSSQDDLTCPGDFFNKAVVISMVKKFLVV